MPRRAITDNEIENCFNVMAELRPHLNRSDFVATVRAMEADGFCLAFIEQDGQVVAAAGYRIYTNLFMGKHCYVDDLVTAESRLCSHGSSYGSGWFLPCLYRTGW